MTCIDSLLGLHVLMTLLLMLFFLCMIFKEVVLHLQL